MQNITIFMVSISNRILDSRFTHDYFGILRLTRLFCIKIGNLTIVQSPEVLQRSSRREFVQRDHAPGVVLLSIPIFLMSWRILCNRGMISYAPLSQAIMDKKKHDLVTKAWLHRSLVAILLPPDLRWCRLTRAYCQRYQAECGANKGYNWQRTD